jgi:TPR repeat protein
VRFDAIIFVSMCVVLVACGRASAQANAATEHVCPKQRVVMNEKREALVIVNDVYPRIVGVGGDLPGVRKNRDAAESSLCDVGFHIVEIENGTKQAIVDALDRLQDRLDFADVGLIYYSGHGALTNEDDIILTNYNPNAPPGNWDELKDVALSWSDLKKRLTHNQSLIAIIIDDACRSQKIQLSGALPPQAGDPRSSAYIWSAGRNVEAEAGGDGATRYSDSLFHFIDTPGSTVQFVAGEVASYIEGLPRPPDYEQVPQLQTALDTAVIQWAFLPDGGNKAQPVSHRAVLIPASASGPTAPKLGVESIDDFAELATDHRFHLVYWRLKQGAMAPDQPALRVFYDALLALQIGDLSQSFAKLEDASHSPSTKASAEARDQIGWMEATGRHGQANITRAMVAWHAASDAGSEAASDSLGVIYRADPGLNWGISRDAATSFSMFERASPRLAAAKSDLAYAYWQGLGVGVDRVRARSLFEEAANAGDPSAMVWLSSLDWPTARPWLQKAAFELHDPQAVSFWARRYIDGMVKDSSANVVAALETAALTGDPSSQFWYGYFLECRYGQDHSAPTYDTMKAMFTQAAQGGYNEQAADSSTFNAVVELSRIYRYERAGTPLAIVPACR